MVGNKYVLLGSIINLGTKAYKKASVAAHRFQIRMHDALFMEICDTFSNTYYLDTALALKCTVYRCLVVPSE